MPSTTVRPGRGHRDRHAHHDLVAAVGHAAEAVQHRQREADGERAEQRQRQRAADARPRRRRTRSDSILPSRPRSMTPERSASVPASAHRISGTETRSVEASSVPSGDFIHRGSLRCGRARRRRDAQPQPRQRRRSHLCHRAGEQHDQPLQGEHHVAAEAGDLERELRAALVERAEQQRRQHDAHRVVAPDQRHRDAREAGADDVVEQQPAMHAGDFVDADQCRRARPTRPSPRRSARAAGCRRSAPPPARGRRRGACSRACESQSSRCTATREHREQHAQVQRRARPVDTGGAEQLVHARHFAPGRSCGFRPSCCPAPSARRPAARTGAPMR